MTVVTLAAAAYAGRVCYKVWRFFKVATPETHYHFNQHPEQPQKQYQEGFKNPMTKKEAALILGIGQNAAKDKVKEAHKRLIVRNHPDTGGSDYLAAKINQAKDTMMKKKKT